MKMNIRAEKAFTYLPTAIDQIDKGMYYSFKYGLADDPDNLMLYDTEFKNFKVDLTYLLDYYKEIKYFSEEEVKTLKAQMFSPDRENWLVAFTVVDNQKHKLWTNE